jgi:hypothetical protein
LPMYAPPANTAGPVPRAGLTEGFVTGIRKRWVSVRQSPMGIPANPSAAPFEVVSMITYKKKKVARVSIRKHDVRLYLPELRLPIAVGRKATGDPIRFTRSDHIEYLRCAGD